MLGEGVRLELAVDRRGRPLAIVSASANVAETKPAEPVLAEVEGELPDGTPALADRGYDSDPLRERLPVAGCGGSRRLRCRWVAERTIGRLKQLRRLNVRWEYYSTTSHGFAHLA